MQQRLFYLLAFLILLPSCASNFGNTPDSNKDYWYLVYSHNEKGEALSGSKQGLINAVRDGKPIRVYWRGRRVEHVTDAGFLTILGGEVFAQIHTITGQKPSINPPEVQFRDNEWKTIHSTNGDRALKWFALH